MVMRSPCTGIIAGSTPAGSTSLDGNVEVVGAQLCTTYTTIQINAD